MFANQRKSNKDATVNQSVPYCLSISSTLKIISSAFASIQGHGSDDRSVWAVQCIQNDLKVAKWMNHSTLVFRYEIAELSHANN